MSNTASTIPPAVLNLLARDWWHYAADDEVSGTSFTDEETRELQASGAFGLEANEASMSSLDVFLSDCCDCWQDHLDRLEAVEYPEEEEAADAAVPPIVLDLPRDDRPMREQLQDAYRGDPKHGWRPRIDSKGT